MTDCENNNTYETKKKKIHAIVFAMRKRQVEIRTIHIQEKRSGTQTAHISFRAEFNRTFKHLIKKTYLPQKSSYGIIHLYRSIVEQLLPICSMFDKKKHNSAAPHRIEQWNFFGREIIDTIWSRDRGT